SKSKGGLIPSPLAAATSKPASTVKLTSRLKIGRASSRAKARLVGLAPVTLTQLPDNATGTSRHAPTPAVGHANTCNVPAAGPEAVGVNRSLTLHTPGPVNALQVSKSKSNGGLIPSPLAAATS